MEINWLFATVAALFTVFILTGWHKGFLKIVISFAGTLVIILTVAVISPRVSKYIKENTSLYEHTREKVTSVFLEKLDQKENEDSRSYFEDLDIPDILKNDLMEKTATGMYQALLTVVIRDYISGYLAGLIINAGSFVGIYIALSVALFILMRSSDLINHIPVIKGINKFLGALTGASEALIIVWVFFFIVIMFLGNDLGSRLLYNVQASKFLRFLFNNNFLFRFIS